MRARRGAYRQLLSAAQLAHESVDDRERRWTERLSDGEGRCWLLSDDSGLFGFAYTAPARDEDLGSDTAELVALYLLPDRVGRGFGRWATRRALDDLEKRGFVEVVLWVAAENARAVRFYAAAGFETDGRSPPLPFGETGLTRVRLRRSLGRGRGT